MKKLLFVFPVNGTKPKNWIPDRNFFSGLPFSIYNQLKNHYFIDTFTFDKRCSISGNIYTAYTRYILKISTTIMASEALAKKASRLVEKKIKKDKYDCVVLFGVDVVSAIAYLDVDIPVIFLTDSICSTIFNYYWFFDEKVEKRLDKLWKKALYNSTKIILPSDWAVQTALNDYHISPSKIELIHFGANVEVDDFKPIKHEGINLLFVGIDGKRKGVDIAIECVKKLNQLDSKTHYQLNIVGCNPDCDDPAIHVHGFINRETKEGRDKLDYLRAISDFFIMPTRAEAAGLVFCEANAYKLPSLSYRTGGVPDYVLDGENGILLENSCNGEDFAKSVLELLSEESRLVEMKQKAYELYCEEYNWEKFGYSFCKVIEEVTN